MLYEKETKFLFLHSHASRIRFLGSWVCPKQKYDKHHHEERARPL